MPEKIKASNGEGFSSFSLGFKICGQEWLRFVKYPAISKYMTNEIKLSKQDVRRLESCGCGCGGSDSWHRKEYKRTVFVESEDALEGFVQLPMSEHPVRVTRRLPNMSLWYIDMDSIVH